MITKHDLDCAIAECQGDPNPNAQTCSKLASYYTIYDHMYKQEQPQIEQEPTYSMDAGTVESDTDFGKAIADKTWTDVFPLMDELMTTLSVLHPALYRSVMRRLD